MAYDAAFKAELLNFITGNGTFTPPVGLYLELITGVPRVQVTFGPVSGTYASNDNVVTFPILVSDYGSISSTSIWDAISGGAKVADTDWMYPASVDLTAGKIISFPVGSISLY